MRILGKALTASLFTFLIIIFVILGTLRFGLLNKSFLFSSLDRNGVYEKLPKALAQSLPNDPNIKNEDERREFAKIANSVSPHLAKRIIETNFAPFLDFINGESKDIKILIPAKELGIEGAGDISWSLSQMENGESSSRFSGAYGLSSKILIAWFLILLILVGLFFLYGRLMIPPALLGGKTLLLTSGIFVIFIGIVGRFFSWLLETKMPIVEPAQALLKLLSLSLFPEIAISWIIFGAILLILFLICRSFRVNKKQY